jgi:hypothetical protein
MVQREMEGGGKDRIAMHPPWPFCLSSAPIIAFLSIYALGRGGMSQQVTGKGSEGKWLGEMGKRE